MSPKHSCWFKFSKVFLCCALQTLGADGVKSPKCEPTAFRQRVERKTRGDNKAGNVGDVTQRMRFEVIHRRLSRSKGPLLSSFLPFSERPLPGWATNTTESFLKGTRVSVCFSTAGLPLFRPCFHLPEVLVPGLQPATRILRRSKSLSVRVSLYSHHI